MTLLIVSLLVVLLGLQRFQEAQGFHVFQASQASRWSSRKTDSFRFTNVDRIASKCKVLSQVTNEIVGQSTESLPRLRVVLDLDETMVHMIETKPDWKSRYEIRPITFYWERETYNQWIIMRPKLNETLELLSQHADLYIFSAGADPYVEAAAKSIDPTKKFFKKIFGRSHKVYSDTLRCMVKDISVIEKKNFLETRTLLIDNWRNDFDVYPKNGLLVKHFNGDQPHSCKTSPVKDDEALYDLAKRIVEKLAPVPDIRPFIHNNFIKTP